MKPLTPSQTEECRIAAQNVVNMEFLAQREEFLALIERWKRRSDELADQCLHSPDLTPVEREERRQMHLAYLEVLATPQQIREGGMSVLRMHGMD